MIKKYKKLMLIILDGFGYRADRQYNAIADAHMPCWQSLWKQYPHALIQGAGRFVGLPDGQMGNSEVGHLTLGAGRVIQQELTRIDQAIKTKTFFNNAVLTQVCETAKQHDQTVHIMGLLSDGGVHSHEGHIQALFALLAEKNIQTAYLHAFLDGRDTSPKSAVKFLRKFTAIPNVIIASIMGRYYAMDRDNNQERTLRAFHALTELTADFHAETAEEALSMAYLRGETDEFVQPSLIYPVKIRPEDLIIFMNFRADRARQLTRVFLAQGFQHFVSLTSYAQDLPTVAIFPSQNLQNTLSEYLSNLQLKQYHIAETEKYAHVTFFFNGGIEKAYAGETRVLIPSPKVSTYDLQPAMSALAMTEQLVQAINARNHDFFVCNYANPDMLGHTGNHVATVKSLEIVDKCLVRILSAARNNDIELIITADHGNAECTYDSSTQQAHTAHTSNPVPFIYIGRPANMINSNHDYALSDVAPTILYLMGLPIPIEMTGKIMINL